MSENNSGIWRKKGHMSKKNQVTTQCRKEEEVGTLLLGNDKNVIVIYLLSYLSKGLSKVNDK